MTQDQKTRARLIALAVLILLVLAGIGGIIAAVYYNVIYYHEVSSVDELYAMQRKKNYILTCDLDLNGKEWDPLTVKNFNGNGHTIKNATINTTLHDESGYIGIISTTYEKYGGFFSSVETLQNVVFENMSFTISMSTSWVGIAAGSCDSASNITVKNSSLDVTMQASGYFYCGGVVGKADEAENLTIENSSIVCRRNKSGNTYAGGVVGHIYSIEDANLCQSNSTDIKLSNATNYGSIIAGGIIGLKDSSLGSVSQCSVQGGSIKVNNSAEAATFVGGIAGKSKCEILQCSAKNVTIEAETKSGYDIGGIVGVAEAKISNCLSDGNILSASVDTSGSYDILIGGLCATAASTISKSIAINNNLTATSSSSAKKLFVAGLSGHVGGSVANCAVNGNRISGDNKDVFSDSSDTIFNCVIGNGGTTTPNENEITVIADESWNTIIQTLSLDPSIWKMDIYGNLSLNKTKVGAE
jgi:hypothetical protein